MYQPKSREEYIAKCRYYKGEPMDEEALGENYLLACYEKYWVEKHYTADGLHDLKCLIKDYKETIKRLENFYKAFNTKIESKLKEKETKSNFAKVIRDLNKVGLVSADEAVKDTPTTIDAVFELNYFKDMLVAQYEEQIISKYKLALQNELEKGISVESLYVEYQNLYNTQKASYDSSNANYETALSQSGKDTFVVYHPGQSDPNNPEYNEGYNGYGYVMNLLLGFNTTQKALLDEYSAKPNIKSADIESYRKQLFSIF